MFHSNHIGCFTKFKYFNFNCLRKWTSAISDAEKDKFSTLYVSGRYGQQMYSILKPILNLDKFLDHTYVQCLKDNLSRRHGSAYLNNHFLNKQEFLDNVKKLIKLKEEREQVRLKVHVISENIDGYWNCDKLNQDDLVTKLNSLNNQYYDLEEKIVPFILSLPNLISDSIPIDEDEIVKKVDPKPFKFKILDNVKLAYLNQCWYSSIVGPNSVYLFDDGAKLYYALKRYFTQKLQSQQFIPIAGVDFVKSGIAEACHTLVTNYEQDPLLLLVKEKKSLKNQQLHFVGEGSFESLAGFLSRRDINLAKLPFKLMSIGSNYTKDLTQQDTIRCLMVVKDDFIESQKEMDTLSQNLWTWFEQLKIPLRLIKVCSSRLKKYEYFRYEIEAWFPSSLSWECVSYINHYGNLIPRLLSKDQIQFIDAFIFDSKKLIASIIENNQTEKGKFQFPVILTKYINNIKT